MSGVAANSGVLSRLFQQGEVDIAPMWHSGVLKLKVKGVPVDWVVLGLGMIGESYGLNIVRNPKASLDTAIADIDIVLGKEAQTGVASSPYYFGLLDQTIPLAEEITKKIGAITSIEFAKQINALNWPVINNQRHA